MAKSRRSTVQHQANQLSRHSQALTRHPGRVGHSRDHSATTCAMQASRTRVSTPRLMAPGCLRVRLGPGPVHD
jgi:hypothetical protein